MQAIRHVIVALALIGGLCLSLPRSDADQWNRVVDVTDHGALGNGVHDDGPAIEAALREGLGGRVHFPPGTYVIESSIALELTDDLSLSGEAGEVMLLFGGDHAITFTSPELGEFPLVRDANRGSLSVFVDNASAMRAGDIVRLYEPTVAETAWNTLKLHLTRIRGWNEGEDGDEASRTEAGELRLEHALNFDYVAENDAVAQVYRPAGRLSLEGLTLKVRDEDRSRREMMVLRYLESPRMRDVRIKGAGEFAHRGVQLVGCIDGRFRDLRVERLQYAFRTNYCRNLTFNHLESHRTRHPLAIASWTDTVHVNHLHGNNNQAIVNAHPSFNVHYNHVQGGIDSGASNLRSVGGSIRNAQLASDGEIRWGPYFQTVALVEPSIYDDYEFHMENVRWRASAPIRVRRAGTAVFRNVRCIDLEGNEMGISVADSVGRAVFDNAKPGPMRDVDVHVRDQGPIDAKRRPITWADEDGEVQSVNGAYVLDFLNAPVTRTPQRMRADGTILRQAWGEEVEDPVRLTVRVHANFASVENNHVFGILRLKALLRHSNVGGFDLLEQHYHFRHKLVATSTLTFPTTPAFESEPTGHPNESLAMTVSNVIGSGAPADQDDRWIQFDVELSSDRTNPSYQLLYELELFDGG